MLILTSRIGSILLIAIAMCTSLLASFVNALVIELTQPSWVDQPTFERAKDNPLISKRSKAQRIIFAKQLLGLPVGTAPGVLWRAYMTRLYALPFNATIEQMRQEEIRRDFRYERLYQGLPEWWPDSLMNVKSNFEYCVTGPLVEQFVWLSSPSTGEARGTTSSWQEFEELYATQIIQAFGLPRTTTKEQAWAVRNRCFRIFGGVCSKREQEELKIRRMREESLLVLGRPSIGLTDQELRQQNLAIIEAIHEETPALEIGFPNMFY